MKEILKVEIKEVSAKKNLEYFQVLKDISFTIHTGKIYTVIGKNGSGKSTFFKTISRLLNNNLYKVNCNITFNDKNIYELNDEELVDLRKYKMKYVLQDTIGSFDPLKKFSYYFKPDNIQLKKTEELFQYFLLPGLSDLSALYPYEVSGGMAQRISIVLALLAEPELLLLDEPTSSLDAALVNLLINKLKEFAKTHYRTILLVTQDILFAEKVSTEIAFLENGKLSEFIKPDEFFYKYKNLIPAGIKDE